MSLLFIIPHLIFAVPMPAQGTPGVPFDMLTTIGTSALSGGGVAAILMAIGVYYFKPIMDDRRSEREERKTADKLAKAEKEIVDIKASHVADVKELSARIEQLETKEQMLMTNLQKAIEESFRMAKWGLEREGRLEANSLPDEILNVSDVAPTQDGPSVLIVEDNESASRAWSIMLERAHCRVRTTFTLADGMKAIDHPPFPDVVILDLMLPRGDGTSDPGDGVDILRKIREENINARVIIVTGRPMDQIDYVRELKPFAVFKKPVNFKTQLYPAVRGVAK